LPSSEIETVSPVDDEDEDEDPDELFDKRELADVFVVVLAKELSA